MEKTKSNLSFTKYDSKKVGRMTETPIEVSKNVGELTIKDVNKLKNKLISDAEAKYGEADIYMIKVLAGSWMTFTSEEKFNTYFDSEVKDASKFYEFEKVIFYLMTENTK